MSHNQCLSSLPATRVTTRRLKQPICFCSVAFKFCFLQQTYLGRLLMSLKKSMVNLLGPLLPRSALKPSNGTLEVPVTNCTREQPLNNNLHTHLCSEPLFNFFTCICPLLKLYTRVPHVPTVTVLACKSRNLCSLSNISTACQNHWTTGCSGW